MNFSGPLRCTALALIVCFPLLSADKDKKPAKPKVNNEASAPTPSPNLIWPLPPDPPRIRWVTQYDDLTKVKKTIAKKQGLLEKLAGAKPAEEKLELVRPYGIVTDGRGRIYAADTELKLVWFIDPAAKIVEKRVGNSRVPLLLPIGLALDASGRLFVSDAQLHAVVVFSPQGEPIAHFGTSSLSRPGGIALDRQRNRLYVADAKDSRVVVFDTQGLKLVTTFGGPNKAGLPGNGTFFGPTNVALDRQGQLYVADTMNYRVVVLTPDGKFVRTFGMQGDRPGEFVRPKGIAVDSEGHIYVADAEFNNFQIFSQDGKPLLAVGSLGKDPGQFALIAGIHIDNEDQIYTTEMFYPRIQVFHYISQTGAAQGTGAASGKGGESH